MWCSINKINQSAPCCLNKSKPQFEFFALFSLCILSPCLLYESESLHAWRLSCESVRLCLSVCLCVPNTRLLSAYIEQHRKPHMGKEWGIFCRICRRVWQGVQLLNSTDPKNIIVNKMLCSVFVVDIYFVILLSTYIFAVFTKCLLEYSCIILG